MQDTHNYVLNTVWSETVLEPPGTHCKCEVGLVSVLKVKLTQICFETRCRPNGT